MGTVLNFLLILGVREQLATAQAEVAELQWTSEGLARQLVEAAHEWDNAAA
jgi:hypothetical protein